MEGGKRVRVRRGEDGGIIAEADKERGSRGRGWVQGSSGVDLVGSSSGSGRVPVSADLWRFGKWREEESTERGVGDPDYGSVERSTKLQVLDTVSAGYC